MQKGMECQRQWFEEQVQRATEVHEADALKHTRQQELLQASKDTLQKQLATVETEFRLALQVSFLLAFLTGLCNSGNRPTSMH